MTPGISGYSMNTLGPDITKKEVSFVFFGLMIMGTLLIIVYHLLMLSFPSIQDRQYLCEQEISSFISVYSLQDIELTQCYVHSQMLSFPAIATIRTSNKIITLSCDANPMDEFSRCQYNLQ